LRRRVINWVGTFDVFFVGVNEIFAGINDIYELQRFFYLGERDFEITINEAFTIPYTVPSWASLH